MADVPESITVSDAGFTLPTSEILTGRGFITGKSGSGKSVLEGTIVYTESGRKVIEDVERGEKVLSLNKHDSQPEFREVLATLEHEADDLLRIRLADGTELVGTTDHSFLTVADDDIVPIRGDELEEGTPFPVAATLPGAATVSRIDLTAAGAGDPSEASTSGGGLPEARTLDLDVETGRVLGLYLGAGSVDGQATVRISGVDAKIGEFLDSQGFTVADRSASRSAPTFGRFVVDAFGRSAAKTLPNWVFDAPRAFKAGLLSGFLDADATGREAGVMVAPSTDLLGEVQELLRHFGIASTVRGRGQAGDPAELRVDPRCLGDLRDVGRSSDSGRAGTPDRASSVTVGVARAGASGAGIVGGSSEDEQPQPADTAGLSAPLLTDSRASLDRPVDRAAARATRLDHSGIEWLPVTDIEPLEETRSVYDLDVRLNDNFIANGVFVHNSNTASVIAEELLEHGLPMLVVDTDGEYYGLKTRYELLHVGAEGDCDAVIGVEHAEKLAELALLQNVPVILDISGFVDEDERLELVRRVVERLFELGKQVRKPFLVLVEEIHEFLPQSGGGDDLSNMLITVAKRGRKRGIGLCGMSQRPAAVDKDYITQCDWVVWHRLTWDNDKRVASQMLGGDIARGIDDLDTGEGLLMTDWDDRINRVRFRRKRTFDAGATPGLDDIDGGAYSPVSSALISELSAENADLNDIDVDDLPGARKSPDNSRGRQADSEAPAEADGAGETALEAAPVADPGTDVVTIPNRPSSRPRYTPPEPAEDEPFDPVWEVGHLSVYLVTRLAGVGGTLAVGTVTAVVTFVGRLGRGAARQAGWLGRHLQRDAKRARELVGRRAVTPTVRELERVAAYGLPDWLIAATVITLLAIAIGLLLIG